MPAFASPSSPPPAPVLIFLVLRVALRFFPSRHLAKTGLIFSIWPSCRNVAASPFSFVVFTLSLESAVGMWLGRGFPGPLFTFVLFLFFSSPIAPPFLGCAVHPLGALMSEAFPLEC